MDHDPLADPHPPDLGFLEVGHDEGAAQWHHAEQRPAGAHVLARPHGAGPDDAAHRRADDGAGQVDAGGLERCAGLFDLGLGLGAAGAQRSDGPALGFKGRGRLGHAGAAFGRLGADSLQPLGRDPARTGQLAVAIHVGRGDLGLGLGRTDAGRRLGDLGLAKAGAIIDVADGGFRRRDIGLGLEERRLGL